MGAGRDDNGSEFGDFIAQTAAPAYARLFARTGDFSVAQDLLARGYETGYREWLDRPPDQRQDAAALERLVELAAAQKPAVTGAGSQSSYSGSAKVRAVEEAGALLRDLPEGPRVALFLEIVEELPEESIRVLTGLDAGDLKAARADLHDRIARWRPGDPEAVQTFERIVRQHRLSPAFRSEIMSRVRRPSGPLFGFPGLTLGRVASMGFRGFACMAIGTVVLGTTLRGQRSDWSMDSWGRAENLTVLAGNVLPVWLDFFLWTISVNLRWAIVRGGLTGPLHADYRLSWLRALDHVGLAVLTWSLLLYAQYDVVSIRESLGVPVLVRGAWFLATLVLVSSLLCQLLVHRAERRI